MDEGKGVGTGWGFKRIRASFRMHLSCGLSPLFANGPSPCSIYHTCPSHAACLSSVLQLLHAKLCPVCCFCGLSCNSSLVDPRSCLS